MKQYIHIKRIIDIIVSTILLILLIPIFIIISIIVKIEDGGKILFAHKRIGKNGKEIKIYKFRTMDKNAEELIKDFTPEQMREFNNSYKLRNDPRVTKVGKILRKTSLDELPQLVNILKGDLSLIGPRPITKEEIEKYVKERQEFLSVTPGLTGYWAAYTTPSTTYKERVEMELYYVKNISFKLDCKIFFKTIITVIKKTIGD